LKHVEDSNKHIIEEIVRQVGYLPENHFVENNPGTSLIGGVFI
jgi:hypothetical protein